MLSEAGDTTTAIEQWARALGSENVLTDEPTLSKYASTTLPRAPRPVAVLRPDSTAQVVKCVAIARAGRVPLYPISRGKNWGYGDACPVREGQAILELSRMNRVLEVDPTLALAVIEPGVTQGELSTFLRQRGLPLWLDCTGAGPDTSIVGNILDRGFGHTPYGNRPQFISGMEVVTGEGQVLRTGLGHYEQARAAHTYPYGVGPSLDGLFMQSNFGIVTKLCIWLMPRPESFALFVCTVPKEEDLGAIIDQLRVLKLDGSLRSVVHIGNDLRLISSASTAADLGLGSAALPASQRAKIREKAGIGAWTFAGGLYGSRENVQQQARSLRRRFRSRGWRLNIISERQLETADRLSRWIGRFGIGKSMLGKLRAVRGLYDLNRGIPARQFLAGAYWRRRGGLPAKFPAEADPALDQCGLLWLSPVLPMTAGSAEEVLGLMRPLFEKHDFDFFVTFSTVNERSLAAVMTIAYDKSDAAACARAERCYEDCLQALMQAGYIPYRVGIQSMDRLAVGSQDFWPVIDRLRQSLDPDGIIAPGRYQPTYPSNA